MNKPVSLADVSAAKAAEKDSDRRKVLEKLQRDIPDIIASQAMLAQITRAKYISLLGEGFTPEQALELCKTL